MKIFVINLKKDEIKKQNMINELNKYELDYEFIEAINGYELSQDELRINVKDYENCFLSKGEIGCALSHQLIYKKMIKDNLHHCLILEDDVEFNEKINLLIQEMDEFLSKKDRFICLAYKSKKIFNFTRYKTKNFDINESYQATGIYGYFITKQAAKSLLKLNYPIILEADMFQAFYQLILLRTYCLNQDIINTTDIDSKNSNIQKDRQKLALSRKKYRKKFVLRSFRAKLVALYEKIFKRMIIGIKRNEGKNI